MVHRLADLELFLRIVDRGSISTAARSLGLSPAVGSQRLRRLEDDLGVRLVHRTTRQLHATPEGVALAEQGRALVEELQDLTGGLRDTSSRVTGTLRLTMPPAFGARYLSPLLSEFLTRYPNLKLSVTLTDRMLDLVDSGYDLAIRVGTLDDSSLVARKIANNRRVVCAAPAYLRRHGIPRIPDDLANHHCLMLAGSEAMRDVWHFRDVDGEELSIRVSGRIESNQGSLLRDAAVAGLGIAQHSLWHVHEDLREGRLQTVLDEFLLRETGIYALMPQRRQLPMRVRALVDFLAAKLGDALPWDARS